MESGVSTLPEWMREGYKPPTRPEWVREGVLVRWPTKYAHDVGVISEVQDDLVVVIFYDSIAYWHMVGFSVLEKVTE